MLGCHGQKDLLERVGVIINEGQDAAETVNEMVEETAIDIGFDSVDEEGEVAWHSCQGVGEDGCGCARSVSG
jgi:hypothetical protein